MAAQQTEGYLALGPMNSESQSWRKILSERFPKLPALVFAMTMLSLLALFHTYGGLTASNAIGSLNLIGTPTMRGSSLAYKFQAKSLLGGSSATSMWQKLAFEKLEGANRCYDVPARDVSMQAEGEAAEAAVEVTTKPPLRAKDMAGVTAPLGFWDPLGYSTDIPEGKLLFYREVELKHGRICMLASLGFLVAEKFHPLFGGNIDVPSYVAFQQTPLQSFWPAVVLALGALEVGSVNSFQRLNEGGQPWQMRTDREPGWLAFDPLDLKPKNPSELKEMQTKELNNGRLAMIATAGMIGQELATGKKLF